MWDATCPDTLAPSHIALASREPGLVAEQAEQQKKAKYADLLTTHHFVSIGLETTRVFGPEALSLFQGAWPLPQGPFLVNPFPSFATDRGHGGPIEEAPL